MDPCFLALKTTADNSGWTEAVTSARGTILAAGSMAAVTPLEPGSNHSGLVIARFAFAADRNTFWNSDAARQLAAADGGLVALACNGIPYEGWPGNFVPTIASVDVRDTGAARAFMMIEGTGTDQARMDRYRDIILPLMRQHGAYYVAFELGGDVEVLAGEWREGIFAISRWPSKEFAENFWYSDEYQKQAIPIRTGVGRFDVQIIEGIAG